MFTILTTTDVVAGFTLFPNGSYSFDATQPSLNVLPEGLPSTLNINYTVSDNATDAGNGALTDTGTLVITVTGTNDAPTVTVANAAPTVNEGTTAVTTITTSDVDAGDTLSAISLSGADAALFQTVGNQLSFKTAPDYEVATDANADGVYEVTVNVTDSNGATSSQAVSVTVADVAEASSFVLTQGTDSFTGADGDDTFTAVEVANPGGGAALATWTTGDALVGGDGDDTLTITQAASITAPLGATITGIETININQGSGSSTSTAASPEAATVVFQDLDEGHTLTIAGVTFTAGTGGATAAQVADAFVTTSVAAGAVTGGTLSETSADARDTALATNGYTAAAGGSVNSIVFTSNADPVANVTDLVVTGTAVTGRDSVQTFTVDAATGAASTVISFTVNGTTVTATTGSAGSDSEDAAAIAAAINGFIGKTVATAASKVVTVTNDTPLSIGGFTGGSIVVTTALDTAALDPAAPTVTITDFVAASSSDVVTLDASGYTGTTALNVTNAGEQTLTAAATTNVTSVNTAQAANNIAIDGGNAVTVTTSGVTTGTTTIGATTAASGDVVVTATGAAAGGTTMGAIAVTGGQTVSVTTAETASTTTTDTETQSAVTVTGDANTTAVTVSQTAAATSSATAGAIVNGAVTITDANSATADADTITTVTLTNYGNSTIESGALSTLNLSGTSGTVGINGNVDGDNQAATTLNLNLNGLAQGTNAVSLSASANNSSYTTVNLDASTAASDLAGLSNAGTAQVTALNISGDAALTLGGQSALTSAAVITSTNSAGVTLSTALAAGQQFVGGAGADTIEITGAATVAHTMGDGDDQVTFTGATISTTGMGTGGSLAGGEGTDTLVMAAADAVAASGNAAFNTDVSGFETLRLSDALAAAAVLDVEGINDVTRVELAAAPTGTTATINNLNSGGTIELENAASASTDTLTVGVDGAIVGAADVLNLETSNSSDTVFGIVEVAGVETINILADDPVSGNGIMVDHTLTLTADAVETINISGSAGFVLTYTGTTVTTVDGSGMLLDRNDDGDNLKIDGTPGDTNGLTWTSAALTAAVEVSGGEGDDTFDLSAATATATVDGGAGDDTITGGTGADSLTGGAGDDDFAYASTSTNDRSTPASTDTISDFTAGSDNIALTYTAGDTANTYSFTDVGDAASVVAGQLLMSDTEGELFFNTATSQLMMDLDGDGQIQAGDLVINLSGNTGFSDADLNLTFIGGTAADTVTVGDGDNVITGGQGADVMTVGDGTNTFVFTATEANDTVSTDATIGLNEEAGDTITGFGSSDLIQFASTALSANAATSDPSDTGTVFTEITTVADLTADATNVFFEVTSATVSTGDDATEVASFLASVSVASGSDGGEIVFAVSDGTDTYLWLFDSDGGSAANSLNATIDSDELTLLVTLTGVTDVAADNFDIVSGIS